MDVVPNNLPSDAPKTESSSSSSVVTPQALIRKREQIKSSNKMLFIWVAIGSVIVSFALVASIFLAKQVIFGQKVLDQKYKSVQSLKDSKRAAGELNDKIDELRADRSTLYQARATSSKNNLDVVLDALPYDGDRISFGSSLQKVLLVNIGVDKFSIQADDIADENIDPVTTTGVDALENLDQIGDAQIIPFNFELNGTSQQLDAALKKLKSSIRPIKITNITIEASAAGALNAKIDAVTYYQEKKTFELQEKVVKP